jgi:SAM-dependent methyltransferase
MSLVDDLMFRTKLQVVKALVQPGRTLDVGCGDQRFTKYLPDPIGVDKYHECDHIYAKPDIWMDACDLKFPGNSFDNVTYFDVLEHIPEADVAVKEAWRVLKPNGILAITDPNDPMLFWARLLCLRPAQAFRGRRTPHRETEDSPGHIHQFNKDKLVELTAPLFKLEKVIHRIIFTGYRFRKCADVMS